MAKASTAKSTGTKRRASSEPKRQAQAGQTAETRGQRTEGVEQPGAKVANPRGNDPTRGMAESAAMQHEGERRERFRRMSGGRVDPKTIKDEERRQAYEDSHETGRRVREARAGFATNQEAGAPEGTPIVPAGLTKPLHDSTAVENGIGTAIVAKPYGSEPRAVDPKTGQRIDQPLPQARESIHGDDQSADVDAGHSARSRSDAAGQTEAMRESRETQ
jgi:hypothetical protein